MGKVQKGDDFGRRLWDSRTAEAYKCSCPAPGEKLTKDRAGRGGKGK